MLMWSLNPSSIKELLDLPETGMGFQLVEAIAWGQAKPFLVFNSQRALDLSEIDLESGDDPSIILRNGRQIINLLSDNVVETMIAAPGLHSFKLLNSRISTLRASLVPTATSIQATLPSSLVKHVLLTTNRVFHRFSAFQPDRRVDPMTGNFLAGTYAAPESEVDFVPTGFTVVGRFALPNNLPASHHYVIEAPTGTSVDFGTVAPAFGQAGGGVEAYFQNAVMNAMVSPSQPSKLPDE